MNSVDTANMMAPQRAAGGKRVLCTTLIVLAAVALSACGNKEKKAGQSLASVNGEEITILQLNEELQRSGVQPAQQEAASKQLLEALIDRQLLQSEAAKDKTDRDPKVVQAIERAKALIVAQAYMQKKIGAVTKPNKQEVEEYFDKHPDFFTKRKQFDMRELVIATRDMGDPLKAAMDSAKSLEEVAVWLDAHQVKYGRTQLSRTSADLAPELSSKLLAMPKGQLFIIKEGERSMLIQIADIKDTPVSLAVATPQIEQFLFNKKNKEAADAEIARLRASAKIEYLQKAVAPAAAPAAAAPAAAPPAAPAATLAPEPVSAPAAATAASTAAMNDRGAAGLK